MENRIPASGQEGRVYIAPENGEPFYATITMADGATVLGTAWSKENVLQDPTCEQLGIPTTAVPNDAFLACSGRVILSDAYTALEQSPQFTPAPLDQARYYPSGATAGEYAVIAGGLNNAGNPSARVSAYDDALTLTTADNLSQARREAASASVGEYAIFAGGNGTNGASNRVDCYDANLTHQTPTDLLPQAVDGVSGAPNGAYAVFAGGLGGGTQATVVAYDDALSQVTPQPLSYAQYNAAGAQAGEYAVFANGSSGSSYISYADAYDQSLTRTTAPEQTGFATQTSGASTGGSAVFVSNASIAAYDSQLTKIVPEGLSSSRIAACGGSAPGGYAVFGGGVSNLNFLTVVDVYDSTLARTTAPPLSSANANMCAAATSQYLIFAGGSSDNTASNFAQAYIAGTVYTLNITVPAWYTYSINGSEPVLTQEATPVSLNSRSPFNGYIAPKLTTLTGQI
jgi:hypothetical protein